MTYNSRDSALTALVAAFADAGGLNTLSQVEAAINTPGGTAEELAKAWGGGEHEDGFKLADDLVHIGTGEDPADIVEIAVHIKTHRADIIMASSPIDATTEEDQT